MVNCYNGDFPGGSVFENPPSNAGDKGSVPGRGTKISQAMEQLKTHKQTSI